MVGSSGENHRYVRNTFIYDIFATFTLLTASDRTHTTLEQPQRPWRFENNEKSAFKSYFIVTKVPLSDYRKNNACFKDSKFWKMPVTKTQNSEKRLQYSFKMGLNWVMEY